MQGTSLDLLGRRRRIARTLAVAKTGPATAVAVDGAVVRLRVRGPSPVRVVLVPDPPNVIEHYDALLDELDPSIGAVCLELPGFGFSVPPPGFRFTLDEQADVAAAVLEGLDVRRAVWAASCLPAYVGLSVAHRHRGLLSALVCGQMPSWEQELAWARRLASRGGLARPVVGQLVVRAARRRIASGWYDVAAAPYSRRRLRDVALRALDRGAAYSLASAFQAAFGTTAAPAPTDLPATFVWGVHDRTHGKSDPASARAHAPGAELVDFRDSAHFPELEEPRAFAELLRKALDSQ